jgi:hypothetical protein
MLPAEADDTLACHCLNPATCHHAVLEASRIVTVPDVDTLEARVARIESMVSDLHSTIGKIAPIVNAVSAEMAEKGPVGMLGYLMAAMRQG